MPILSCEGEMSMGIYIKGMEMPTGERPVHIEIHRDGTVLQWKFNESDEIIGTAVEVPQHNELIDAENCVAKILDLHRLVCKKINNAISQDAQMTAEGARIALIDCAIIVKDMPTIIEAEG